jgi:hypothetical protein
MTVVTVKINDDSSAELPVEDVTLEIYDGSSVFQTSGISDADGLASVSLPDGTYVLYLFKSGVTFLPRQPQTLVVVGPSENVFQINCHVKEDPESDDPLRCTVSGTILGVNGLPTVSSLIFDPVKELMILSGKIIAPDSRLEVRSDKDGYFEFELLRNRSYSAYFLFPQDLFDQQPGKLNVVVPDRPRVDLHSLLFPLPVSLTFSAPTITLPVSSTVDETISVEASFTDNTERGVVNTPWAGIFVNNPDPTIAEVSIDDTTLLIKPLSPGTINVTTFRELTDKVVIDPLPDFSSGMIIITIT